jgi:signal recognition particle receptor subunit beta
VASINYATREISCKIVFYGPGLSGKTTNLQIIHRKIPDKDKSEMVSLATETDRTLFFDFLPLDLGSIKGFSTKFQLYTVPGQVYYNATRKLVLRGVDGVVFVVDSQADKLQENLESFTNLQENLREYGHSIEAIPVVLQYNKRDLPNVYSVDQINQLFNKHNLPFYEAVAATGVGVFTTLKAIGKLVIDRFNAKYAGFQGGGRRMQPGQSVQASPRQAPAPPPPAADPRRGPAPGMSPFASPPGGGMPGMPRPPAPGPGFPPQRENPFAAAPPSSPGPFAPAGGGGGSNPGPGHPPFMIPTPFQNPPGSAPGGFPGGPPPQGPGGFPGAGQGPQPFPNPGSFPGAGKPPGQAFPQPPPGAPPGNPPPFGGPGRPPFPGAAPPAMPQGNMPVSPFVESFNNPRGPGPGPAPGPMPAPPGLQSASPFGQGPGGPGAAPFPGFGGGPGQTPSQPPPFPQAGRGGSAFPPPGGPGAFAPGMYPAGQNPQDAEVPPPSSGTGSAGLKASFEDNSGIISTYEDVQRDENFKTRKLPLPGEKKKGFFDGLFRKDK